MLPGVDVTHSGGLFLLPPRNGARLAIAGIEAGRVVCHRETQRRVYEESAHGRAACG